MQRLKRLILLTLAILAILSVSAFAESGKYAVVSFGTPQLDAQKDDCYGECEPLTTENVYAGKGYIAGAKGTAYFCWDYNGLYMYIEVNDKTYATEGGETYHQDSVECFFDEDFSRSYTIDSNDCQYRITRENVHTVGMSAQDNFKSAVRELEDGGYAVEACFPWKETFPEEGKKVGFDFMVNDALGLFRQSLMMWSATENKNYQTTEFYGTLELKNGPLYKTRTASDAIKVVMNGYLVGNGDVDPVIVDNRTLVPMRPVFKAFSAECAWNGDEETVYAIGQGRLMTLKIGSDKVYIDDTEHTLDVPAMVIDGRTMVPIRFIAETFGADVSYKDDVRIVEIKYDRNADDDYKVGDQTKAGDDYINF